MIPAAVLCVVFMAAGEAYAKNTSVSLKFVGSASSRLECLEIAQWSLRSIGVNARIAQPNNIGGISGVSGHKDGAAMNIDCFQGAGNRYNAYMAFGSDPISYSGRNPQLQVKRNVINALRRGFSRGTPDSRAGCWACVSSGVDSFNPGPMVCLSKQRRQIPKLVRHRLKDNVNVIAVYKRACPNARLILYQRNHYRGQRKTLRRSTVLKGNLFGPHFKSRSAKFLP